MIQRGTAQNLFGQISGGLLWALFFVFAPVFEILWLGAFVWLPLFIWRERLRTKQYGFFPGAAWRFSVIAAVVALAALAPFKYSDRRVGPFKQKDTTLSELTKAGIILPVSIRDREALRIRLPSLTPTRREIAAAINQAGLRASIWQCGNASNILFGGGGAHILVIDDE